MAIVEERKRLYLGEGYEAIRVEFDLFSKRGEYIEPYCTKIVFRNIGSVRVRINGAPINPGGILPIVMEFPYFDITKWKYTFDNTDGERLLLVERHVKAYLDTTTNERR